MIPLQDITSFYYKRPLQKNSATCPPAPLAGLQGTGAGGSESFAKSQLITFKGAKASDAEQVQHDIEEVLKSPPRSL